MNEQTKKRSGKRRRAKRRKLLFIVILLALCVAAAMYIIKLSAGARNNRAEEAPEETVAEETADNAEAEAEAAAAEKAASHVYSHRGSQGDDELTFAAYDRAIEAGSKYIEADMVVSASGTMYLAHDDYAYDMTGINGYFSGMVDSQIDELKTKSGNSILKLSDLFDKYGDSVTYLVDIKYSSSRNIEAFTDIVQKYGFEDNVIAVSFYLDALRPLEDRFPDMTKLYLSADQPTFDLGLSHSYLDIVCAPKELMTAENLKAAHESDKKYSVWTLNTEEEIKKAIELGVDSYFTDDSALAIELEKELRAE